ncbi:hypothetical protein B0H17DRAFT_1191827 [Mycena rosella]|uniref:Mif2/CENP-C cupin domain-containing protein n=1 Tax=Mycena rosella TaxID=1033263 RepID=A0AAD7MAK6_MYCRO|nr:hypothetical protein B0H17DRAFT_1191827 [Mycena rosella]
MSTQRRRPHAHIPELEEASGHEELARPRQKANSGLDPPYRPAKVLLVPRRRANVAQRIKDAPYRSAKVLLAPRRANVPDDPPYQTAEVLLAPRGQEQLRDRHGPQSARPLSRSTPAAVEYEKTVERIVEVPVHDLGAGGDEDTQADGGVDDYTTDKDSVKTIIVFMPRGTEWELCDIPHIKSQGVFHTPVFHHEDRMVAGQLWIEFDGFCNCSDNQERAWVFTILEGAVAAMVNNQESKILTSGGVFIVPIGNSWQLENIGYRPAILSYTSMSPAHPIGPMVNTATSLSVPAEGEKILEVPTEHPEAGWDENTDPWAVCIDHFTGNNVDHMVAFPPHIAFPCEW